MGKPVDRDKQIREAKGAAMGLHQEIGVTRRLRPDIDTSELQQRYAAALVYLAALEAERHLEVMEYVQGSLQRLQKGGGGG